MPTSSQNTQVMEMLRWLLIAIFVVLGWIVLRFLAGVLAPILAAMGIAYMLDPVLERLVRRGLPRALGAAVLLALCVTLIVGAIMFAAPRVYDQLVEFVGDMPRMVDNLSLWLHDHVGVDVPSDWKVYVTKEHLQGAFSGGPLRELATAAVGGVFHLLGVMAEMLLIPVFSFYFLVDWPNLLRRIDHMIPPRRRREVREVGREIDGVVAGWVRGQAIVTTILAILYATGFTLVGMPLSLPIGLLVGALTVIPFVGTFVGAAIAALVTVADGGSMQTLAMVAGVILCLHLLEAGVLTPKIVGHRVGLSESGALFAVVAGGKLLGFVGVVLAVPIAATCAVLVRYAVRYYEHTAFFGRESDADVVITPAMALVMPGVQLGGEILEDLQAAKKAEAAESTDDWAIEDEPREKPSPDR
ncbi:MAG TPA: AI-2E family transporter [Kofleriaceae bacterium]|nr:AI-2E family transporter [Kofleriaceae bacterium]